MLPGSTACPPNFLTPNRRPAESRPLRVEPPDFFVAQRTWVKTGPKCKPASVKGAWQNQQDNYLLDENLCCAIGTILQSVGQVTGSAGTLLVLYFWGEVKIQRSGCDWHQAMQFFWHQDTHWKHVPNGTLACMVFSVFERHRLAFVIGVKSMQTSIPCTVHDRITPN